MKTSKKKVIYLRLDKVEYDIIVEMARRERRSVNQYVINQLLGEKNYLTD